MAIMTAIGIGLAASSVVSGVLAKKGADAQARAAERSSAEAIAEQRRQFNVTQQNQAPFLQAGTAAVQRLQFLLGLSGQPTGQPGGVPQISRGFDSPDLLAGGRFQRLEQLAELKGFDVPDRFRSGTAAPTSTLPPGADPSEFGSLLEDFNPEDFQGDPGFEFRLAEGKKALERSAAARGGLLSGGTLKELERFAQGTASQEFSNAFNRFQASRTTRFNFLANLAGGGSTTAAQLASTGERTATNIGNLIVGGQTAAAAARASGFSALGQGISGGINNFLLLSQLAQEEKRKDLHP